jgi:hypothetical protein
MIHVVEYIIPQILILQWQYNLSAMHACMCEQIQFSMQYNYDISWIVHFVSENPQKNSGKTYSRCA